MLSFILLLNNYYICIYEYTGKSSDTRKAIYSVLYARVGIRKASKVLLLVCVWDLAAYILLAACI